MHFNLVFYYRYKVTFLHVYYAMVHSFSRGTRVLFRPYREVLDSGIVSSASCCWLSLPDLLSRLVLKSY